LDLYLYLCLGTCMQPSKQKPHCLIVLSNQLITFNCIFSAIGWVDVIFGNQRTEDIVVFWILKIILQENALEKAFFNI
jgi:hypothetical protein